MYALNNDNYIYGSVLLYNTNGVKHLVKIFGIINVATCYVCMHSTCTFNSAYSCNSFNYYPHLLSTTFHYLTYLSMFTLNEKFFFFKTFIFNFAYFSSLSYKYKKIFSRLLIIILTIFFLIIYKNIVFP